MECTNIEKFENQLSFLQSHQNRTYEVEHSHTLEIFARTLFSGNLGYAKFRENKTLAKCRLLIKVNFALIANFSHHQCVFSCNSRKLKFSLKFPNLQYRLAIKDAEEAHTQKSSQKCFVQ